MAILLVAFLTAGVARAAKIKDVEIVPGKSIGPVSVGMTRAQVEGILGRGVVLGRKGTRVEEWSSPGLAFFFKGSSRSAKTFGGVVSKAYFATAQHISVGAKTAQVEGAYPSLHCKPSEDPEHPEHPWKSCTRLGPPGRITIFYFDKSEGEVTRIAVGASSIASTP
jgi:hypothetical protein